MAAHAADRLALWHRTFITPISLVPDQKAHFINDIMKNMADFYKVLHKPTVAYSPWVNGTVERLSRYILAAMVAMRGELKLWPHDYG